MRGISKKIVKIMLIIFSIFLFVGTVSINFSLGYSTADNFPDNATESLGVNQISINQTANNEIQATWSFSPNSFNCSVVGEAASGACSSGKKHKGEIEISYTGEIPAIVSFDYEVSLNGGSCRIDTNNISANGTFKKTFNGPGYFFVLLTSTDDNVVTSLNVKNFKCLTEAPIHLTFLPTENGSYSVNGDYVTSEFKIDTNAQSTVSLSAIPDNGYKFYGWISNGSVLSRELDLDFVFDVDSVVYASFVDGSLPIFLNSNQYFTDFDKAISSASQSTFDKKIVLVESGTIAGGTSELIKEYRLSNGLQLIIPDKDNYQIYLNDSYPVFNSSTITSFINTPAAFKILSIPDFTNIICEENSIIYVASEAPGAQGGQKYGGNPVNYYGEIKLMGSQSLITLDNGSSLYAYGYITGLGRVDAFNGALVREFFQITDFKGGSKSLEMIGGGPFLINKYYVQNIESTLRLYSGAKEEVITGLVMRDKLIISKVEFISSISSNYGLFKLGADSMLEKSYDGTTDRLIFKLLKGEFYFSNISLTVSALGANIPVNTKNFELPVNNNMTIEACNGTVVTINQDLAVLPGAKIIIDEKATINIAEGTNIYLFDRNSYTGKNFSRKDDDIGSTLFAVTRTYERQLTDLINAELDINGTLNVSKDSGLYTTRSSTQTDLNSVANFYSSNGTGVVNFVGEPTNLNKIQQYNRDSGKVDVSICRPALRNSTKIENSNDTYLDLRDYQTLSGKTFYFSEENIWTDDALSEKTINVTFIDETYGTANYVKSFKQGESFIFPTAEESGFIFGDLRVRRWKIEGVGDGLFIPGEEVSLSVVSDLTVVAVWGGRVNNQGDFYYIDYHTGEYLSGINRVEHYDTNQQGTYLFKFNEQGFLDLSFSGLFLNKKDGLTYYISLGMVVTGPSLIVFKNDDQITSNIFNYVYVDGNNHVLTNGEYYIETNSNDVLPSGYYNFEDGYIKREDDDTTMYNQTLYVKNNVTYIDGIRVAYGLFKQNNYLYYSDSNGNLVKNKTFYVADTKDYSSEKVTAGLYYFDFEGRMCDEMLNPIEVSNL